MFSAVNIVYEIFVDFTQNIYVWGCKCISDYIVDIQLLGCGNTSLFSTIATGDIRGYKLHFEEAQARKNENG